MTDRKQVPGKFVWFELVGGDAPKAQAFYGEVFGWKTRSFPLPGAAYDMIYTGDDMIGGYAAAAGARRDARWLAYASVEDVDAAVRTATERGGAVVVPAQDIPTVGRRACVADPQGAELGLFRSVGGDMADADVPQGGWCWNELHTPDPAKALGFYDAVVGFTHRAEAMGPGGTYHVVAAGGVDRGGASAMIPPGTTPHWLPYVRVADVDGAIARAKRLGATVTVAPMDIPDVGRIGCFDDPQGAHIAVINPRPRARS
jgi:predicted enzyme related to lactoylglutathione lyase